MFVQPQTTIWQYTHGVPDQTRVSPDGYGLDNYYLARSGADEIQLDLFLDYASNVALYPTFQEYFRASRPPLLAVWGRNDPFFLPAGAEAFKRDIPDADVRFVDTGHFALETHAEEIATAIAEFLTQRESYSIASADGEPVAITVERLDDGEASPYLTGELRAGDKLAALASRQGGYSSRRGGRQRGLGCPSALGAKCRSCPSLPSCREAPAPQ